jgi:hypothetical protein
VGLAQQQGRAAAAAKIRSCHSSSSARQGKRDKYSQEIKQVSHLSI